MTRRSVMFILILLGCWGSAQAGPGGFVSVRGKDLVAPQGTPLILRGINLGNWLVPEGYMFKFKNATSPRMINDVITALIGPEDAQLFWKEFRDAYITNDDIRYIKSIGLNSVRVPFNARLFIAEGPDTAWQGTGFAMLDRVIQWCGEEGLWVILDMHCAPAGQTGDNIDDSWGYPWLFRSPEYQERTVELWRRIAERYKNETALVGYDLLNEPIAHFHDTTALNPLLEPLYKRIVTAIQSVDSNHIVFLGGAQWDTNFKVFGPPFAKNLAYTFHKYWMPTIQEQIQEYVDYRDRHNVPIWLGESGENTDEWVGNFRELLERNQVGWCFWPFKKPNDQRCVVTFPLPEGYQVIKDFADSSRATFEQIRTSRPDRETARRVLFEFARNSRFSRCRPNEGYLKALGLKR